ncbi:MAG: hypothetical protein JXR95_14370 [Deltaproteobacteria bacterium]|nr:hypothetical protein [Deltaproteobacteria bacterium]
MKKIMLSIFILVSLGIVSGCETGDISGEFREALPESDMISLDIPSETKKDLNDLSEHYSMTLKVTRDINYAVLNWLLVVKTIISFKPTQADESEAIWGPWLPDDGLSYTEYRFVVNKDDDSGFNYRLQMRTRNPVGEYVDVYTGHIDGGSTSLFNSGTMEFNFDAAGAVDPAITQRGSISVIYDYSNGGKNNRVSFDEFTDENGNGPTTAEYHYVAESSGEGYFDFETWGDVHADSVEYSEYTAIEHLELRSRWNDSGDGRCDVMVTEGDLETLDITDYTKTECWNDTFSSVYMEEAVSFGDGTDYQNVLWGESSSCPDNFLDFSSPEL